MKYKITIAIPTYRRKDLLIKSIESALNQLDYNDYETLIVDNDSEDLYKIEEEVKKLCVKYKNKNIRYYRNKENLGMTGNWNKCIELSLGEYITILNDDDVLYNNYLKEVSKLIENDKAIFFNVDIEKNNIILKKEINKGIYRKRITIYDLFLGYPIASTLGILFRRETLLKIGAFKERYYPTIDSNLLLDYVLEAGAIFYRKKVSGVYRINTTNATNTTGFELPRCDFLLRERIINEIKISILKKLFIKFSYYLYKSQKEYIENTWNLMIPKNERDIKINRISFFIFL